MAESSGGDDDKKKRKGGQEVDLLERAFATGDKPSSLRFYRVVRRFVRAVMFPYFDLAVSNEHHLDVPGAAIVAPVHRSHLDSPLIASLSQRRQRALGKESLFTPPVVRWVCAALGAIPVRRGEADRDALKAAKVLLDRGESMFVFPEGGRQSQHDVGELFAGAAWLASKTGAHVIPVGISGTAEAMGEGARFPRRKRVGIAVGEPMAAPVGVDGKRVGREQLRAFTAELAARLQELQDDARELARDEPVRTQQRHSNRENNRDEGRRRDLVRRRLSVVLHREASVGGGPGVVHCCPSRRRGRGRLPGVPTRSDSTDR